MKTIRHTNDSLDLVNFAIRNPGWHSFKKTKRTLAAVNRAEELGRIEVSRETTQFRLASDV